jgi:hypothetical protein
MIREYSTTAFTYQTDVLPALSSISNRVRNMGCYYGGLWESSFAEDLLWHSIALPSKSPCRTSDFIAPSFLWASVNGAVRFIQFYTSWDQKCNINNISLTPEGHDPLGRLKEGYLCITGPTLSGVFVNAFERPQVLTSIYPGATAPYILEGFWGTVRVRVGSGKEHFIFHMDISREDIPQEGDNRCLQLFAIANPGEKRCYAMVLFYDKDAQSARRIGLIATIPKLYFDEYAVTEKHKII